MTKLWTIIKREYITRVRSKLFIFTTIGMPLAGIGYVFFISLIAQHAANHSMKIAVIDETGTVATLMAPRLDQELPNGEPQFRLTPPPAGASEAALKRDYLKEVRTGTLDGYLLIPKGVLDGEKAEFHTRNVGDLFAVGALRQALSDAVIAERLHERGVEVHHMDKIIHGVQLQLFKIARHGQAVEKGQTVIIGIVMVMLLYTSLLVYGVTTARSILEEKTTRMVEILTSSVRPVYLLAGKILGVAGVALTQYLVWAISAGLLLAYGATMAAAFHPGTSMLHIHVPFSLLIYAILFFLAGYFLYASVFAALGSMVSTEQDLQQVQVPVTMIIVGAVVLFNAVLVNPNSSTSIVLSEIPFFAPILMVLRIAVETPPFWQIALAFALLALTTLIVVRISARIYRVGILMYGKRPSVAELLRWLKYT